MSDVEWFVQYMNDEKERDIGYEFSVEYEPDGYPDKLARCFAMSSKMKQMYRYFSDFLILD